jgi:hypothetical protein
MCSTMALFCLAYVILVHMLAYSTFRGLHAKVQPIISTCSHAIQVSAVRTPLLVFPFPQDMLASTFRQATHLALGAAVVIALER